MTNTVLLTIIAVCNVVTPLLWLFVRRDIKLLELNTNSKMDAMLALKGESEFAKGVKSEADRNRSVPTP